MQVHSSGRVGATNEYCIAAASMLQVTSLIKLRASGSIPEVILMVACHAGCMDKHGQEEISGWENQTMEVLHHAHTGLFC
jgi:hypothetical protein